MHLPGLIEYLNHLALSRSGRLRHLMREAITRERNWLNSLERLGFSFDPGRPVLKALH